jgi:hypothetical protein
MTWTHDDGGRVAAGFKGAAGDCVTRAIAIATESDYRKIYDDLAKLNAERGSPRSARNGIWRADYQKYLEQLGWTWTPTMGIGTGCQVHLRADELPAGRIIVRLSRHVAAVVNGVLHDTYDSSRDGTRCVYGYFTRADQ